MLWVMVMIDFLINDEDIDRIETLFENSIKYDTQRRNIIKSLDSINVQALPGTGKTTVVVGKLAALLLKWDETNKGICVLSHTNVAKNEINRRFKNTMLANMISSYPHFIGTFHSFINTYITLPWLKSNGYNVNEIDYESIVNSRYNELSFGTKNFLKNKRMDMSICESIDFPNIKVKLNISSESKTYKEIVEKIESSMKKGYFTFDEMLIIAKYVISNNNSVIEIIQRRFPIVIIDEAQDTNEIQWELINLLFPQNGKTILQLFGDDNQAIYDSNKYESNVMNYPCLKQLSITDSYRFGEKIASIANSLLISKNEIIGMNTKYSNVPNYVLLFDQNTIESVLPKFSELVISNFKIEELKKEKEYGIHAVGMVCSEEETNDINKYPKSIKSYFENFDIDKQRKIYKKLIDYFYDSKMNININEKINRISDGLIKTIKTFSKEKFDIIGSGFKSLLNCIDDNKKMEFRKDYNYIVNYEFNNKNEWVIFLDIIFSFLKKWFGLSILGNYDFFSWNEAINSNSNLINTYSYMYNDEKKLDINLGSIHSVKGETHLATLVLETFWYDRNIKSILKWLEGEAVNSKIGKRDEKRLKCHFVALSRAKGMVCIAIMKEDVSEIDLGKLKKRGWQIVDLTNT